MITKLLFLGMLAEVPDCMILPLIDAILLLVPKAQLAIVIL